MELRSQLWVRAHCPAPLSFSGRSPSSQRCRLEVTLLYPGANASAGKTLFMSHCASCHGEDARGAGPGRNRA